MEAPLPGAHCLLESAQRQLRAPAQRLQAPQCRRAPFLRSYAGFAVVARLLPILGHLHGLQGPGFQVREEHHERPARRRPRGGVVQQRQRTIGNIARPRIEHLGESDDDTVCRQAQQCPCRSRLPLVATPAEENPAGRVRSARRLLWRGAHGGHASACKGLRQLLPRVAGGIKGWLNSSRLGQEFLKPQQGVGRWMLPITAGICSRERNRSRCCSRRRLGQGLLQGEAARMYAPQSPPESRKNDNGGVGGSRPSVFCCQCGQALP
mmetsp:Transcript_7381/g.20844  ORF Transcript_7381/g.20844 Transcript_7381/m.20844 type:complete len:265 (+) Transcript_7381:2135-2929(+)